MVGPTAELQNPSLMWAGQPTKGAFLELLKRNIPDESLGLVRKEAGCV